MLKKQASRRETALRRARGFGAGMAPMGQTCGAVTAIEEMLLSVKE